MTSGDSWHEPTVLGDSLSAVVRSLRDDRIGHRAGSPQPAVSASALGGVFGRWLEAVGPAVAEHVQPKRLDGTRLLVEVDEPAWATQIRFLESTLKQRLLDVAGVQIDVLEVRVARQR